MPSTPPSDRDDEALEPLRRLTRDLRTAARTLSDMEVRYLVDSYYQMQEGRKTAANQVRALESAREPHEVISWLSVNHAMLERNIKSVLDVYTSSTEIGRWAKSITGIGPVISAGLEANINITKCPTAGHIWRFAGLDPTREWLGKKRAEKIVREIEKVTEAALAEAARQHGLNPELVVRMATTKADGTPQKLTRDTATAALARRPWNGRLKTLCWKIGESFVKVSGHKDDIYGKHYLTRKAQEQERNEAGAFAEQALIKLQQFKIGKSTEAYKYYNSGKLPPAHIHARAKRWAVKLFLSHWQYVAYSIHYGEPPPKPYILTQEGGHAHEILPPNWP